MNAVPPSADSPTTLFHRRHARMQRAKGLSHLAPALMLVMSALAVLTGAEQLSWITGLEFAIGGAYLALLVRELRHLRHHPHHQEPVAWLELAAAGVLAVEGYHIWHRHHAADLLRGTHTFHVLPYIYWTLAGIYLALGFAFRRLVQRRHLHLHPAGFSGRTGPFRKQFQFKWADVAAVEPDGPADVLVRRTNGQQQRVSFAGVHDGPAHRNRLLAHIQQHLSSSGKH